MFILALFTIAKRRKQPKCLAEDEWVKKKMAYIHNGILFSFKNKRNPIT